MKQQGESRRDFLKTGAVAAAGAVLTSAAFPGGAFAAGSDEIKVGVIGCGGRGSGAAANVLHAAKNVTIHALGDVYDFRVLGAQKRLESFAKEDKTVQSLGNKVDVAGRTFHGLDAYKKVMDSDINYVILATPPGFRPVHLEAAVNAGKKLNIFTEKPVAVDGPGLRKVLEVHQTAMKKGIAIAAGTQRRHQMSYLETMKRVHEGAIGDIVAMRCYWNQGPIWFRKKKELADKDVKVTDLAFQLHNWYHFVWVCGDHILEQHVHNLDVCNWAMGTHPVRAVASGGRAALPMGNPNEVGHIFDHFSTDYEYPKGVHMLSMCRQIAGCENSVSEALVGTKGVCQANASTINGKRVVQRGKGNDPYVQEHTDLIASIREGKPLNELQTVAHSTLTALMGRMSGYTGKAITWEMALNSKENTMPENLSWDMKLETPAVAVPGKTEFV